MMLNEEDELRLRALLVTLTPKQLRYVAERYRHDTTRDALVALGWDEDLPYRWKNLEDVKEAVQLMAMDGVLISRELLRRALPQAAVVKVGGLESGDERIQQSAATEILDRFHGKPTQKNEVTGAGGKDLPVLVIAPGMLDKLR